MRNKLMGLIKFNNNDSTFIEKILKKLMLLIKRIKRNNNKIDDIKLTIYEIDCKVEDIQIKITEIERKILSYNHSMADHKQMNECIYHIKYRIDNIQGLIMTFIDKDKLLNANEIVADSKIYFRDNSFNKIKKGIVDGNKE